MNKNDKLEKAIKEVESLICYTSQYNCDPNSIPYRLQDVLNFLLSLKSEKYDKK